ncbi:MAG: hypothetical protein K8S23_01630 [Candidatus Cloacimonetes bacterium]|nr:hypothetical protein [Candidatus Cloacimonadota bacterium]
MQLYKNFTKKTKNKFNLLLLIRTFIFFSIVFILFFDIFVSSLSISGKFTNKLFILASSLNILSIFYLVYLIYNFIKKHLNMFQAAKLIDFQNNDKTDTFQNAIELENDKKIKPEILKIILSRANGKIDSDYKKNNFIEIKPLLIVFLIILFSNIVIFSLNPIFFNESIQNFFSFSPPLEEHKSFIEVNPGDISLKRHTNLIIKVIEPELEVNHDIFYKIEDKWRQESLINFQKKFSNLDYSFDYFIRNQYAISDTFSVKIFELPVIKNLRIRYEFPAYTGLKPEETDSSNGMIKAMINSEITINFEANNPIEECKMIFSNGEVKNFERLGKKEFKTKFKINESGSYHINLVDILQNKSEKIERSIIAIPDNYPEIRINYPAKDTILTQNLMINLKYFGSDDFGLRNLKLHYFINNNEEQEQIIKKNIYSNLVEDSYIFDFSSTFLLPGDRITYWLSIQDNSPDKKIDLSNRYILRFPSIEEIYQEIEEEEKKKTEILQNTLEKSQEMQKELEQKRREIMKKKNLDWNDKQDLEKFLKDQEKMNNEIKKSVEDYQEMIDKYKDNKALSQETLDKMEKIKELMEDISNDQLREAMQKLQEKMENMKPEDIKKAMENLKLSLEDFSEKLDQTIKMLEDIKKEQALQKSLEIAKEMEKMQEDLNERTESGSEKNEELAKDQEKIKEKLDKLKEQLEKTQEMLDKEKDADVSEAMDELMEEMEQDNLEQDLSESQEDLQSGKPQKAQKSQKQASNKMQKMSGKLSEMMSMMSSGSMMEMGEALEKAMNRLLIYSFQHEKSKKQYVNDPFLILPDQIANFEGIKLTLNDLYSTPMIVLLLGPKFIYDANQTMNKYQEMFQHINDAKKNKVRPFLSDIQGGLNIMVYDLMQASQNMSQSQCQGGGMQSLMQSMQQMGEQQMMMNMLTQKLLQQMGEGEGFTQDMRNQARRIAQQEKRLAENLKRILQTDKEAQKQTASMNKIIDELEEISRLIKQNKIDKSLIDKQDRILSRLLDAQKSIHKREFSKKRKSEISEKSDWLLPEEIEMEFDKIRRKALLNNDLDAYPKEYQELIKEYLRILNKKASE